MLKKGRLDRYLVALVVVEARVKVGAKRAAVAEGVLVKADFCKPPA